jgi:sugar phosphate isomerase/epimerase
MRPLSLAYLTVNASSASQSLGIAADIGYSFVGLRLQPNNPGAPYQEFIQNAQVQREVQSIMADTGVGVFDIEIIRIGESFDAKAHEPLLQAGQALNAKAVLVAADDVDLERLSEHYAQLCEFMVPFEMTANLEFMPWTGVKNIQDALQVMALSGRPQNAGILIDALHFGRSTSTLDDIGLIPAELLHYAQICDAQGGLDFTTQELIHTAREERLLPGEGTIELRGIFSKLDKDLPISIEIPNKIRSSALGDSAWAKLAFEAAKQTLNPIDSILRAS